MPTEPEEVIALKEIINQGDNLELFKACVQEMFHGEAGAAAAIGVDLSYIFQKVYLHACLKKKPEIAKWLQEVCFPQLPEIEQISIRQCFSYGRHLLNKK